MFQRVGEKGLYAHRERPDSVFFYAEGCREQELSLEESFGKPGRLYVFSGVPLLKPEQVISRIAAFYGSCQEEGFLFVSAGSENIHNWRFLPVCSCGNRFGVNFGGISFHLPCLADGQMEATLTEEGDGFELSGGGELEFKDGTSCRAENVRLLMDGPSAGCFAFCLPSPESLGELGVSVRYAAALQENGGLGKYNPDGYTAIRLLVMEFEKKAALEGVLDILQPEDGSRSYFKPPQGPLMTSFRLLPAGALRLSPVKGGVCDGKFVFERIHCRKQYDAPEYYLAPAGDFVAENGGRLLPGLCGLEYIRVRSGDRLRFCPHCAASVKEGKLESGRTTTPYLTVLTAGAGQDSPVADAAPCYYSQPDPRPFFRMEAGNRLDFCEIPFARMSEETLLPIFPAAGLQTERAAAAETAASLENEVLSQARGKIMREALRQIGQRPKDGRADGKVYGVTEQGVLVVYSQKSLERDEFEQVEFGDGFLWENVSGSLKAALLSGKCFMVITDEEEFLQHCGGAALSVTADGWSFGFSPKTWEENDTALILKYVEGCSLRGLCDLPWSFETSTGRVRLKRLLTELDSENKEVAEFDHLRSIVSDPNWCGILVLSAAMQPGKMPGGLAFLTQGMDPAGLVAHHLIWNTRRLKAENLIRRREAGRKGGGGPDQERLSASTVEGLVYYQSGLQFLEKQPDYGFYVTSLKLILRDSLTRSFSCEIQLMVNRLFGCPTAPPDTALNCLIPIKGVYQNDGGAGQYIFSLTENTAFTLVSAPIRTVRFSEAVLTIGNEEAGNPVDFCFGGELYFEEVGGEKEQEEKGFDLYSYGGESGLCFSKLCIHMERGVFSCPAEQLRFWQEKSVPRENSFANQIPFIPMRMEVHSGDGITPQGLGYMGISVEGFPQAELTERWAAVRWEIPLGDLGALAGAMHPCLLVMTAFSPDESVFEADAQMNSETGAKPKRYVGVRLESGQGMGGEGFSVDLEQFIRLKFGSVEFLRRQPEGNYGILIRDFSLQALGITMPPGGNSIWIFGEAGTGRLAWFAEYKET